MVCVYAILKAYVDAAVFRHECLPAVVGLHANQRNCLPKLFHHVNQLLAITLGIALHHSCIYKAYAIQWNPQMQKKTFGTYIRVS